MIRRTGVIAVFAINAVLAGCVQMKVYDRPLAARDRVRVQALRSMQLIDGASKRQEIIVHLGAPDAEEGNLAVYNWDSLRFNPMSPDWGNTRPAGGELEGIVRRFMILEFDDAGILQRHERRQYNSTQNGLPLIGEVLRDWRETTAPTTSGMGSSHLQTSSGSSVQASASD